MQTVTSLFFSPEDIASVKQKIIYKKKKKKKIKYKKKKKKKKKIKKKK